MKYEYDREKIEFNFVRELTQELNELGQNGWEVIYYDETPPPKFGEKTKVVVLIKKQKSCKPEKLLSFMKKIFRH